MSSYVPKITVLILLSLIFNSCSDSLIQPQVYRPVTDYLSKEDIKVLASSGNFGIKIFKTINENDKNKNLFISPLSLSYALGMTLNGAGGQTYQAMISTLELSGMPLEEINSSFKNLSQILRDIDPKVTFLTANSIWYRREYDFEDDFIQRNIDYYEAIVSGLDFNDPASVAIINSWINDNTGGRIPRVIEKIDRATVMFLINALYFKGIWQKEFNKENTVEDFFFSEEGERINCRKMVKKEEYLYLETEEFQAVDLPYGQGNFSMTLFLPAEGIYLDDFISNLEASEYSDWLEQFDRRELTLRLPKFKFEYEIELSDALKILGMETAFGPDADFTEMYVEGGLFISQVIHKTFVEVSEEGTEAAAVTVVVIDRISLNDDSLDFSRPFIFIIREKETGSILFMGKVVNPA